MSRPLATIVRRTLALLAGITAVASVALPARAQSLEPPPPLGPPAPPPGAAPPPALPMTPVMPQSRVASEEEAQDSGLGLEWVWINADIGGAYVNMQSFNSSNFALQKTESGGPAFGIGAGVRLLFLTLGVRARDLLLSSVGNLWELDAEAKFHTRIWRIDPYFGIRGGYAFIGSLNSESVSGQSSDVSVHGFNVGPVVGIDVYFSKLVSLGFDVDAQFLFLQRPPVALPAGVLKQDLTPVQQQLYNESGSSVGFSVTPTAHLGIHF